MGEAPVKLAEVVVVSWVMVGQVSGGIIELGPGVRGALAFGRTQVARGGETGLPFRPVLSTRRCSTVVTVRNGQERGSVYASGVLGWCGARVRERE
jgi:hypothetical protein